MIHYSHRSNDRIQEDVLVVPGSVPHGEAFERLLFDERAFRGCKTLSEDSRLTEVKTRTEACSVIIGDLD